MGLRKGARGVTLGEGVREIGSGEGLRRVGVEGVRGVGLGLAVREMGAEGVRRAGVEGVSSECWGKRKRSGFRSCRRSGCCGERNTPVILNWFQPCQYCCCLCYPGEYLRLKPHVTDPPAILILIFFAPAKHPRSFGLTVCVYVVMM